MVKKKGKSKRTTLKDKYKIQKRVTGPRFTTQKNYSIKQVEKDMEALKAPGPTTYEQDDRILHEKLRD